MEIFRGRGGVETLRIALSGRGAVELTVMHIFDLHPEERAFVYSLVDQLRAFAAQYPPAPTSDEPAQELKP